MLGALKQFFFNCCKSTKQANCHFLIIPWLCSVHPIDSLIHSINKFSHCTYNMQKAVKNSGTLKHAWSFFFPQYVSWKKKHNINCSVGMKGILSKRTLHTHRVDSVTSWGYRWGVKIKLIASVSQRTNRSRAMLSDNIGQWITFFAW